MKIGIIREGKTPADTRVPLSPAQCAAIEAKYPEVKIVVEPSSSRCFSDDEYQAVGISISENLSECEVLLGVKEVPIEQLKADKTYFFFSHTIKKQPYNQKLLQTILAKHIRLIDYEVLTNTSGQRVIAFGRFAGIAGAHNGLMAYGRRTGAYELPQMVKFKDFAEAITYYKTIKFPAMKIVLTGDGRVANGAVEVLEQAGIESISPHAFLFKTFDHAVFTQLDCYNYVLPKDENEASWQELVEGEYEGRQRFELEDYFQNPHLYRSTFEPYTKVADLMINGIYWDSRAPQFFSKEEMKLPDFKIKVIADITCDIAPIASIPSTLFASTTAEPVFGYDPQNEKAVEPYQDYTIDMMTIDNLPNELPRDASQAFGEQFINSVLEELLGIKNTDMLERATIAVNGDLGAHFSYLEDYAKGNGEK